MRGRFNAHFSLDMNYSEKYKMVAIHLDIEKRKLASSIFFGIIENMCVRVGIIKNYIKKALILMQFHYLHLLLLF